MNRVTRSSINNNDANNNSSSLLKINKVVKRRDKILQTDDEIKLKIVKSNDLEEDDFEENQRILRRVLDTEDPIQIDNILLEYAKTIELLICRLPNKDFNFIVDCAISKSLSPEWYSDKMNGRLSNSMLVGALLLTVSASSIVQNQVHLSDLSYFNFLLVRISLLLNIICSMFFLAVIFFGVSFSENAMNRAYTESDRFVLVCSQYDSMYKTLDYASKGAALFPFTFIIPVYLNYPILDTTLIIVIILFYTIICSWYWNWYCEKETDVEQNKRWYRFVTILDDKGRLKPQFYPKNTIMKPEMWADMYRLSEEELEQKKNDEMTSTPFTKIIRKILNVE